MALSPNYPRSPHSPPFEYFTFLHIRRTDILGKRSTNNLATPSRTSSYTSHRVIMKRKSATKRRGRPPTYQFTRPESELTESERLLKQSILNRRERQNASYRRRKALRTKKENKLPSLWSSHDTCFAGITLSADPFSGGARQLIEPSSPRPYLSPSEISALLKQGERVAACLFCQKQRESRRCDNTCKGRREDNNKSNDGTSRLKPFFN